MRATPNPLETFIVEHLKQRGVQAAADEMAELVRAYHSLLALERVLEPMTTAVTEPAFVPPGE